VRFSIKLIFANGDEMTHITDGLPPQFIRVPTINLLEEYLTPWSSGFGSIVFKADPTEGELVYREVVQ
jgi:hypothetical protein